MPTTVNCTFTAISAGEGIFCIQAVQEDGNKLALSSLLGFELKTGNILRYSMAIGSDMEHHIRGITVEG